MGLELSALPMERDRRGYCRVPIIPSTCATPIGGAIYDKQASSDYSIDMRNSNRGIKFISGGGFSSRASVCALGARWLAILSPGPIEQVSQIVRSARASVGAMAVVERGESGILGDPVVAESFDLSQAAGKASGRGIFRPRTTDLRRTETTPVLNQA
jgi:hypothetical protein